MIDSKWYLFDINNEQTYIILSINEYDLYEKNTSKNKLNRILQSNTSITIDKINLKSWIKKYMSMHTVDNKYNPISSVAITDKIRLPISPRCFVKLSDCSEYAKTSDSKFEDIKISNETSNETRTTFLEYLKKNICMTEKQFGKEICFKVNNDILKIEADDIIHSIRTNIILNSDQIKGLNTDPKAQEDTGNTKEIGNNIMVKITPTSIKNYITELLKRLEIAPDNRFITIKLLRKDNKDILRSSKSESKRNEKSSGINSITNNELFCKFYIRFEKRDQLSNEQEKTDTIKVLAAQSAEARQKAAEAAQVGVKAAAIKVAQAEAGVQAAQTAQEAEARKWAAQEAETRAIEIKALAAKSAEARQKAAEAAQVGVKAAAIKVAQAEAGVQAAQTAQEAAAIKAAAAQKAAAIKAAAAQEAEAQRRAAEARERATEIAALSEKSAEARQKAAEAAQVGIQAAAIKAAAAQEAIKAAEAAEAEKINKWRCTNCGFINSCSWEERCWRCSASKNNTYQGEYEGFDNCIKALSPKVKILEGGDWSKESIYDVNSLANDSNSDNDWSDSDSD